MPQPLPMSVPGPVHWPDPATSTARRVGLILAVVLVHVLVLDLWLRWQDRSSVLADMAAPLFNQALAPDPSVRTDLSTPTRPPVDVTVPVPTTGQVVQARQVWEAPAAPDLARSAAAAAASPRPTPHPPEPAPRAPEPASPGPSTTADRVTPPPPETPSASEPVAAAPAAPNPPTPPADQPGAALHTPSAAAESSGAPPPVAAINPSESPARWLAGWPRSTRLSYKLQGYFRGDFHGSASVQWQRTDARYQAQVNVSVALLLNMSLTSQGRILPTQLWPEAYEEDRRGKKRGVRFGEQLVALSNGEHVPRPPLLQDTASQFVQLSQDFATGRQPLNVGAVVPVLLGRPGGVDEWRYDVVALDTIPTPLGALQAYHLKPRPLDKPRGPVSAEIWFAPALQHLPVRIRLTLNPETWVDLTLEQVQQAD